MITTELIKQAVETGADACKNGCVHEKPMEPLMDYLQTQVKQFGMMALVTGADPVMSIFIMGIHIGYRLHQIESDPTPLPQGKVN